MARVCSWCGFPDREWISGLEPLGTALKPASEPVVVARKPLRGTVASNVVEFGTGALNIDACRVAHGDDVDFSAMQRNFDAMGYGGNDHDTGPVPTYKPGGRWPSNVVWTHAPECVEDGECVPGCPVAELDTQSGNRPGFSGGGATPGEVKNEVYGKGWRRSEAPTLYGDSGGASRFFPVFRWQAKAPGTERPEVEGEGNGRVTGLGGKVRQCTVCGTQAINGGALEPSCGHGEFEWVSNDDADAARAGTIAHPTVKPVDLMRWLVRLVTPPGGVGLDMFAGSGTTGEAALLEGFDWILIEKYGPYLDLIRERLAPYRDPVTLARARGRGERPKRGRSVRRPETAGDSLF